MRKSRIIFLFLLLGVLLFVLTLKQVGTEAVKEALLMFSFGQSAFIFLFLFSGTILMGSLRWRVIMQALDIKIPGLAKLLLIKTVGFSLSYLTPAAFFGGEPSRFFILRQTDKTVNNRLIASLVLDKLVQFLANFFIFLAGLFLLLFYLNLFWLVDILSAILILLIVYFFFFFIKKEPRPFSLYLNKIKALQKLNSRLEKVEEEIRKFFTKNRIFVIKSILYSLLEASLVFIAFWLIIFYISNVLLGAGGLLIVKSMADLSTVVPFPAALGTLEISQAFVLEILGLGAATGVALSLIFRGLSLILASVGLVGLFFFHLGAVSRRFVNIAVKIIPKIKI